MVLQNEAQPYSPTQDQLAELQKAITTESNSAGDIIQPEVDQTLQNLIVLRSPFYAFLQEKGRISETRSAKPSFLKKLTGAAANFIAEGGSITGGADSTFDLITGDMTTAVVPLEISDRMILGSQDDVLDVFDQEIQDGMDLIINTINTGMLTGTGSSYSINGILNQVTTNTTNMSGAELTSKFQVDQLCQKVIDTGGSPTALVTSANVKSQLEELLYPNVQVIPTVDMAFGYQVSSYNAPNGQNIPIIVDPAMPTTANQQKLACVDYTTLMLKYLREPTVVDLAKIKLTEPSVLTSDQSFMLRAEQFNATMYNIGTKTS